MKQEGECKNRRVSEKKNNGEIVKKQKMSVNKQRGQ